MGKLWDWLNSPLFVPKNAVRCCACGHYNDPKSLRCVAFLCNEPLGPRGGGMVEI